MIFNAHPRLYWGEYGADPDPAWLEIGRREEKGFLKVGEAEFETTGLLGAQRNEEGRLTVSAFPGWATIPGRYDLAGARRWHLTFAWIFGISLGGYLLYGLASGHTMRILLSIRKAHPGTAGTARPYGRLQGAAYFIVLFILLPLLVLTGLTMSPAVVAAMPWLLDIFGGRQSARSLHFILAWMLVLFVGGHVLLAFVKDPLNKLRSMLTGWFRERGMR